MPSRRFIWLALVLAGGGGCLSGQPSAPSTDLLEDMQPSALPKPFEGLQSLGEASAAGKVIVADGKLLVKCQFPRLPCDLELLMAMPSGHEELVHVNMEVEFPYRGYLRGGSVSIETNLPAILPCSNVDGRFRRRYKPRSNLVLEYELLAEVSVPEEGAPSRVIFLPRARLLFLGDDARLEHVVLPDVEGPTWTDGTPVYAPSGRQSEEVGRIEARPALVYPWSYAQLEPPAEAREWFDSSFVRRSPLDPPLVLCLSHGYYEAPVARFK